MSSLEFPEAFDFNELLALNPEKNVLSKYENMKPLNSKLFVVQIQTFFMTELIQLTTPYSNLGENDTV